MRVRPADQKRCAERKHIRRSLPGRVFIHDEEQIFIAPLNNLSRGGLFMDKLVSLEVGQKVKIVVKSHALPQPIHARGTVVRVEMENRWGTAVEFDWMDPKGALFFSEEGQ